MQLLFDPLLEWVLESENIFDSELWIYLEEQIDRYIGFNNDPDILDDPEIDDIIDVFNAIIEAERREKEIIVEEPTIVNNIVYQPNSFKHNR